MCQSFAVVRYNFMGFFKSSKVIFCFLLGFVLCFLLSNRVMAVIDTYGTPVQATEPFLWTFGDTTAILLSSMLLLLLLSDLPKMSPVSPYQLIRITKRQWLTGQFFYVILVTGLYVGFMMISTILLCMKMSYIGNVWSETAAMLAYSKAGEELSVPSTVKVMESVLPYGCTFQVLLLLFFYAMTLGFVILMGNLALKKNGGMILGLAYSLYGFLLNPSVLGVILHKEDYEMYQVNVLIAWISPVSHASYGRHNFGYDHLPTVWQSCMMFALLLAVFVFVSVKSLKKYPFRFIGERQ